MTIDKERILKKHLKNYSSLPHSTIVNICAAMDEYRSIASKVANITMTKELREKRHSVSFIAKELGVSRQTVYNYIKEIDDVNIIPKREEVPVKSKSTSAKPPKQNKSTKVAKITPKGKKVRIGPNVYKYDNCFSFERFINGKMIKAYFNDKEAAMAASK